jgi:hypothetical protein
MRKKILLAGLALLVFGLAGAVWIPNPMAKYIISEAKANGYLEYSPAEAHELAKAICTQCHSVERIKLYCPRCGPPFIAVVPHMQTFIDNYKATKPNLEFNSITEHQAVAIVQVWNALIGNWEADFREQDILKLIGHYDKLAALYLTPVEKRPIEFALASRDDLKIGHMSALEEAQKNLGKPENNPQNPCMQKQSEPKPMDHSQMDHSDHNPDGKMKMKMKGN